MKKLVIIILLSTISYPAISQITATIDNSGKEVILNNDGTWKYKTEINKNFDGSGIWEINYFVDDFGDKTDEGYIANKDFIEGVFSNSATTNSNLFGYFIISSKREIAIKLLEYGSSVVKAYSTEYYNVSIKDSEGETYSLRGTMFEGGDRLYIDHGFGKNKISKMHNIMMKGGEVVVVIKEDDYGLTTYRLSFDSDGYKNTFNTLFK